MNSVPPDRSKAGRRARTPATQLAGPFAVLVGVGLALVWTVAAALAGHDGFVTVSVALMTFTTVAALAGQAFNRSYPHDRLGLCNAVTLLRAALASALVAPILSPGVLAQDERIAWAVVVLGIIALALDGLDGWLARRSGLVSEVGARFDMEVDAFLGLILSVLALQTGKAGVWVLALGMLRYVYVAAGLLLPWLRGSLPERFRRKLICVVQIGVLVLLMAPVAMPPASAVIAAVATLLLVWSFAVDVIWLARRR